LDPVNIVVTPGVSLSLRLVRSASLVLPAGELFQEAAREALLARPGVAPVSV
jgi:hypothetical protein